MEYIIAISIGITTFYFFFYLLPEILSWLAEKEIVKLDNPNEPFYAKNKPTDRRTFLIFIVLPISMVSILSWLFWGII